MSEIIINNTHHSTTIIKQIINLLEKGFNNEEISKQSDKLFGYNIQENVIENIMKKIMLNLRKLEIELGLIGELDWKLNENPTRLKEGLQLKP